MRVLAVGAHSDDMELLCGGTLAKYTQQGHRVAMAATANGELGSMRLSSEGITAEHTAEAKAAAAVGETHVVWMGYTDEFLFSTEDTRLAFINLMGRVLPAVVITHALSS